MYKWAVRWMIRRNLAALPGETRARCWPGMRDDAVLVFPGVSSWGGEHRGKPAIEAFLRRFLEAGIVGRARTTSSSTGPPWRTTVCMLFLDRALDAGGNVVYENRAVMFGRVVWGKIVYHEDFEDTQQVEAFDRYLAHGRPGSQLIVAGRQLPGGQPHSCEDGGGHRDRARAPFGGAGQPDGVVPSTSRLGAGRRGGRRRRPARRPAPAWTRGSGRVRRRPSTSGWRRRRRSRSRPGRSPV